MLWLWFLFHYLYDSALFKTLDVSCYNIQDQPLPTATGSKWDYLSKVLTLFTPKRDVCLPFNHKPGGGGGGEGIDHALKSEHPQPIKHEKLKHKRQLILFYFSIRFVSWQREYINRKPTKQKRAEGWSTMFAIISKPSLTPCCSWRKVLVAMQRTPAFTCFDLLSWLFASLIFFRGANNNTPAANV